MLRDILLMYSQSVMLGQEAGLNFKFVMMNGGGIRAPDQMRS